MSRLRCDDRWVAVRTILFAGTRSGGNSGHERFALAPAPVVPPRDRSNSFRWNSPRSREQRTPVTHRVGTLGATGPQSRGREAKRCSMGIRWSNRELAQVTAPTLAQQRAWRLACIATLAAKVVGRLRFGQHAAMPAMGDSPTHPHQKSRACVRVCVCTSP